ncbi:BnaA03g56180D [Brassica napus]|uniref:ADP-ribosyl cyclase/cyclic ADP-ribose hydrolase n=1 Tax=Brassica napus TaxID=3708 RepID=A0A078IPG4_BRANA|nr:BnaA03g56180D [Brassica napus]
MDSSFFLTTVAAAIGLFILTTDYSSSSRSSSLSPSPVPPPSSSRIWTHHVFPSFRGEDVRKDFLSHIQMEFERKGITPFIDNEIKRGDDIGPELIRAIRGSKIAIILLSRNYASSKWCLDELVEIMKCREELGQTVMAIFYKVDPSDVKKLAGDFGRVFKKTCAGRTKENIERWRQALAKVATIAGYHSSNWDNEAAMIKKIATDISDMLNNFTPSNDFDGLVGMGAHLEKMEPLLCLGSDEVRMIGIWGPPGIGKTTIARVVYNQLSDSFQLSVFMDDIKGNYSRLCSDDYSLKLQLQKQFMSQITNHKDMVVSHLGVAPNRLKDKKVLVVLDGVDQSVQLEAMAKETWWFGPGSRIIITTQDQKLFRAHGVNLIYKVNFPTDDEALQIFCTYSFGQKSPKDGFEELAREVTRLAGKLPLGLRVMGSYFRGMSKQEWRNSLPRLRTSLDTDIRSILKFSYDALDDEDKDLFLHIACFFNYQKIRKVEEHLAKKFLEVRQRLNVLAEKSLISIVSGVITMHSLLEKLGREIVCKQSIHEPRLRQFLCEEKEIFEVLTGDTTGSKSVMGINLEYNTEGEKIEISEKAFEGMSNLQFLRVYGHSDALQLTRGLNYISHKLRFLEWTHFPMTCLPSILNLEFLVELIMYRSKLEKLWEGTKPLRCLKRMNLSYSENLKELPDLSTATNLELDLHNCSICLNLSGCSNLVELPVFIGNLQKLKKLVLTGCSKLEFLPTNINLESLSWLNLRDCSMLKCFPQISTNIRDLDLTGTAIEQVPPFIVSWPRLECLEMSYFENLEEFPHALERITSLCLTDTDIQELPPCVKKISRLNSLVLKGCQKLVSIPPISDSIHFMDASDCESLEILECSFHNQIGRLNFANCFKLNQEARDLIIQNSERAVLPGGQVPSFFTHRATGGGPLSIKLNEKPLPKYLRFKACILLVDKVDHDACSKEKSTEVFAMYKNRRHRLYPALAQHLYTFRVDEKVTSSELLFEFKLESDEVWKIGECGIVQHLECISMMQMQRSCYFGFRTWSWRETNPTSCTSMIYLYGRVINVLQMCICVVRIFKCAFVL